MLRVAVHLIKKNMTSLLNYQIYYITIFYEIHFSIVFYRKSNHLPAQIYNITSNN